MQVPPRIWKDQTTAELAALALTLGPQHGGHSFRNTDTGIFYTWNGTALELSPEHSGGKALVRVASQADMDSVQSIDHIAAGTTPTGSYTAGSWVDRSGYDRGAIEITVNDVTPVSDITGTFQISYSLSNGVTQSAWETLYTMPGAAGDDDVVALVDFSSIKNAPYFKVREVLASATTLAAVTFGVKVYAERLRG